MKRIHQILIGLLVVQLALAAVVFWPRVAPVSAAAGGPLLGALKVDDITGVTITDKDGKTARLVRQGDVATGAWALADAGGYPADATKIKPLLEKLVAIKNNRLVTRTAASHARLKVAEGDFTARIELQTAGGPAPTLLLGTSAGANTTHVRLSGQGEVYLAGGLNTWDVRPDATAWVDPIYLNVEQPNLTALTIKNAKGEYAFTKDAQGKWALAGLGAGEQVNETVISGIANGVAPLRMVQPLGKNDDPTYGMANPGAVITIKAKSGDQEQTYTLQVGAHGSDDNTYVVKSSASDYYVRVADFSLRDAVEKDRAGFLQAPTPAPAAPPTPAS